MTNLCLLLPLGQQFGILSRLLFPAVDATTDQSETMPLTLKKKIELHFLHHFQILSTNLQYNGCHKTLNLGSLVTLFRFAFLQRQGPLDDEPPNVIFLRHIEKLANFRSSFRTQATRNRRLRQSGNVLNKTKKNQKFG